MVSTSVDNVNHPGGGLPDDVAESVHAVRHLFRAQAHRALRDGPHQLTQMEGRVLSFVGKHPGATLSELVEDLARDKGQVGRLVAALRDRSLLEARADDADRRIQRLELTPEGRGIQASVQRQRQRVAKLAVTGMDEGEQRLLVELLHRVRANLEAAG